MGLTPRWQLLPKLLLKGMYLKIINFKCLLLGCAFLASITYLILHLGNYNIQEILDFVKMYNLFKNRSASCSCGNYLSVFTTGYMLFPIMGKKSTPPRWKACWKISREGG